MMVGVERTVISEVVGEGVGLSHSLGTIDPDFQDFFADALVRITRIEVEDSDIGKGLIEY